MRASADFNHAAGKLVKYLNEKFVEDGGGSQIFHYANLARILRINDDIVQKVLSEIGGGHNAITIHN
jgi:hypothetical protein